MSTNFPPTATIETIKIGIRQSQNNPNIGRTYQVELKSGPRVFKIATIFEVMNAHTDELHHYALRLDCFEKKKSGWQYKPDRTIHLDGEVGEIAGLVQFIRGVTETEKPDTDGNFLIVDENSYLSAQNVAEFLRDANNTTKSQIVRAIIDDISRTDEIPEELQDAFQAGSINVLNSIAASARLAHYRHSLQQLQALIASNASSESTLQELLEQNPWLFGSEYSELLDRRSWTRDDRLDFMLRRTVDGYLEIVEIKTPFSEPLFRYDKSHDSYYPSAELSKVIGQVMRYIEELERGRDSIIARDGYDPMKIRARIIIGRDGDVEHQKALYALNAHLNQIEIQTFDQLLRIGERVLGVFKHSLEIANEAGQDSFDSHYSRYDMLGSNIELQDEDIPF